MTQYKEEIQSTVFIDNDGNKTLKEYVVTLKDGVQVAQSKPHTTHTTYDADVPEKTADFIEAKKVKQPKK